jgi:hypothetical protein
MSANSEPVSVSVESSSSWIFDDSERAEWLTLNYDNDDPNLLSVSATANANLTDRTDSIVLVSGDGSRLIIPVIQTGMDFFVVSSMVDSSTGTIMVPAAGGEVPLSVFSNYAWSVSTDEPAEKVTIDPVNSEANEEGTPVVVTVAANDTVEEFAFILIFESDGKEYSYPFVQQGAEPVEPTPTPEPEPDPDLESTTEQ